MEENSGICLSTIAGGKLEEKFQREFALVLQNLMDINTPYKTKRKITIDLEFAQTEDRRDIQLGISVKTKLAPRSPVSTQIGIGKDLKSGKLYIEEYGSHLRGQTKIKEERPEVEVIESKGGFE